MIIDASLNAIIWVIIATAVLQNTLYLLQLVLAAMTLQENPPEPRSARLWARYSEVCPPVSLLVPAFNEANAVESIKSLMSLHYPKLEVIAINDGSTDSTLQTMIEGLDLHPAARQSYQRSVAHRNIRGFYRSEKYPNLLVIDKEQGGKSDALNAGINLSSSSLVCVVDADSLLERDALLRIIEPFVDHPDKTVAVGATIRILNGSTTDGGGIVQVRLPKGFLARVQSVEYLRAFLMARLAWSRMKSLTIISGAFGVFRKDTLVEVGGYSHGTVGEDLELVLKIHRHLIDQKSEYIIKFIPDPVCWTVAPESWSALGRQRSRWQRGALEAFIKHKDMLFRPRYGRIGTVGLGHALVVDVVGPPVEVLGYVLVPVLWLFGVLSVEFLFAFAALTFSFGVFVSVGSLILEEVQLRRFPNARDLLVLTFIAVLENFGYRQLCNLWRLRGIWQFCRGKTGWGS